MQDIKRALSYAEMGCALYESLPNQFRRYLDAKARILTLAMENQNPAKAEAAALVLINHSDTSAEALQHASRSLSVIQSAAKHGHLLHVDRVNNVVSIIHR